ncbi:sialidase family protein [Blastococcus atacamensis]|uniref:sialidase family protein n=1 Tax=Blastococcus atacamensis TaxID=2070508 RepID=UPI000CEBD153|nr:sialidase family protein [Blastococcus atacamensis]
MNAATRLPALLVAAALTATLAGAAPRTLTASGVHLVSETRIDTSGDGAMQYRVPALAITARGVLVACYDARNVSVADLPNNIDIVCRRSFDGGETWAERQVVARHAESDVPELAFGVGDPNLTYDRDTGRLFLFHIGAPPGVGFAGALPSDRPDDRTTLHPWYRFSDDDGATWSDTVDLTAQLKEPGMGGIIASAGKGTQLADGTLVVPYLYRRDGSNVGAFAVSADHGRTWRMTEPLPGTMVDEHKVEQLADGSLISNARPGVGAGPYRRTATAPGIDGPWTVPVARLGLPDPGCNGDILRVDPDPDGPRADWLLASNPASQTDRTHLVVRLSKDGGASWPEEYAVETGPSGYSTMVALPDGSFAVLFEHTVPDSLKFVRFGLDRFE